MQRMPPSIFNLFPKQGQPPAMYWSRWIIQLSANTYTPFIPNQERLQKMQHLGPLAGIELATL
jgi:hypothetical protein